MTYKPIPCPQKNGNTPEYRVWCAMKRRCNNPNVIGYESYGGLNPLKLSLKTWGHGLTTTA